MDPGEALKTLKAEWSPTPIPAATFHHLRRGLFLIALISRYSRLKPILRMSFTALRILLTFISQPTALARAAGSMMA
ncbi:hypothetical protein ACFV2H_21020 [Streptomyces sp. NPDC059629]|uniref:hypothetical protein n=1 Tax=Streptomyces sp. NPDC059629 TaxID=3346889 RepID=UPI0036C0AE64